MQRWKTVDAAWRNPPGHSGGLQVADVVDRDTGDNFVIQQSFAPPGGGGEMHQHDDDMQLFYVMSGSLSFDTGTSRFTLEAGEAVLFEPGEPHATLNDSSADSVSLVVTVRRPSANSA